MWAKYELRTTLKGFTIVELVIVFFVFVILAAIPVVAYNGIQYRANDSRRISDMKSIVKALELYKTQQGQYPSAQSMPSDQYAGGWETSVRTGGFLNALSSGTTSIISSVPMDPKNTWVSDSLTSGGRSSDNYVYFYHLYPAGANGCDVSRGAYYVLGVSRMGGVTSGSNHTDSPGFSCSSRNWAVTGAWVTGSYVN